jgi:hypothetical protein
MEVILRGKRTFRTAVAKDTSWPGTAERIQKERSCDPVRVDSAYVTTPRVVQYHNPGPD